MRIALLTDGIHPYVIGGMQKHSFYLAKYFALNKIDVDLYHTSNEPKEAEPLKCFSEEEKKHIHSIYIPFPKHTHLTGHYIRESKEYSDSIFQEYKKRGSLIDFIYSQGFCGWRLIEEKQKKSPLPPIGVNFHGLEMFQKTANLKSKLEQHLFRRPVLKMLKNADVVFSLGGKLTELLIDRGIKKDTIIQLPIGIDSEWIKNTSIQTHSKPTFIFVGRYERRKGIEELTIVLKKLLSEDFEFHFVGTIPKNKQVISPKIHYWGNISETKKIQEIYQKADVLVCPSYSEGMPTVILEAMASGLAVIASNVGAISEQVSDNNGILIMPGNTAQLEKALLSCIKMPNEVLSSLKGHSIQQVKEQFLWDSIITRTTSKIQNFITLK